MAAHGPHERALLALGSQGGVDGPQRPLRARLGAGPHREVARGVPIRIAASSSTALGRLDDEDDVDVADVVELAAAGLAHPDDREPACSRPGPGTPPGRSPGRPRARPRRARPARRATIGMSGAGRAAHVERGDPQQPAPVLDAQHVERRSGRPPGPCRGRRHGRGPARRELVAVAAARPARPTARVRHEVVDEGVETPRTPNSRTRRGRRSARGHAGRRGRRGAARAPTARPVGSSRRATPSSGPGRAGPGRGRPWTGREQRRRRRAPGSSRRAKGPVREQPRGPGGVGEAEPGARERARSGSRCGWSSGHSRGR